MRTKTAILLAIISLPVFATVTVSTISFVIHKSESHDSFYTFHVTNMSPSSKTFYRIEVNHIDNNVVKQHRYNILCPCGAKCDMSQQIIKPWETRNFSWDGNSNTCAASKNGKYIAQISGACKEEGCAGSYYSAVGEYFDVN